MNIVSIINNFIEISKIFLDSSFFLVIKFFLAIYVTVLIVDLILLLIVRGLGGNIRTALKGTDMPATSKKKMRKKWVAIEDRVQIGSATQCKLAILEADRFVDEILLGIGYSGKNIIEKLEGVTDQQLGDAEALRRAHEIRNKIINDSNFFIEKEQASRELDVYRQFLERLEII